ncbi:hypothetical protein [Photobacterium damselae]|uniref:hypothetical protein n=1 Tax=Photobacterium damselae TaxID=38293 RepID=UPI004068BCFB
MSKITLRNFKKLSLLKKTSNLLKIFAVLMFFCTHVVNAAVVDQSISAAVSNPDDAKFNCPAAYISGGKNDGLVDLFNSTICPKDDTVQVAYMFLPHVMKKAADILDLTYKNEISEYFDISEYSGAHVGNFEQVVSVVRSIAIWFISIILCFQIFAAGVKSLTDGHLGGQSWGNFGITYSFCVGIILLLPIGDHMYVGELILAIVFLIGLGICNMGLSTVLYTMGHGADQNGVLGGEGIQGSVLAYNNNFVRDVSDGDTRTPIEIGKYVGDMHAVRYIEANMCVKQTSKIIGINYVKENDHWYVLRSSKINGLLGLVQTPSYMNDGDSTSVEIQRSGNKAIVQYGVNLDQTGIGAASGVGNGTCASEVVSYPALMIAGDEKFKSVYSEDLKKQIDRNVEAGAKLLANASTTEHQEDFLSKKLNSLLGQLDETLISNIANYNSDHSTRIESEDAINALHNLSDYFYKRIVFDIQTGGDESSSKISDYSSRYYGLVNGYSYAIDNGVVGGNCYSDFSGYRNTKQTISALNSGSMPNEENFDLKCANIDNSGFTMSFDANTDSYEDFADSIKSLLKSGAGKGVIPNNYGSLSKYLGNIFGAIYISRKDTEQAVGEKMRDEFTKETGKSEISGVATSIVKEIREHGFPRFGMQFLSLFKETERSYDGGHRAVPSIMPVFNTMYSASNGYVSSSVNIKNSVDYVPSKILMPPEFYDVVSGASYANTSDIQNAIISKIGSMDSGNDGGNSSNLGGVVNGSLGLKTMSDMSTSAWQVARNTLISLLPVLSIPSSVLTAHSAGAVSGISKDAAISSIDSRYASPVDIKYALEDLCRGDNSMGNVSNFVSKNVCERYNRHPLVYYQDVGVGLIKGVGVMTLAYIGTAMAGTVRDRKLQALNNKQKAQKQKNGDDGSITGSKKGVGALKDLIKQKSLSTTNVLYDSLANTAKILSGVYIYVMMLLLLIGIVFAFVMPVLPYLIFTLAWLNYILMFLQFIAVSMMLYASLVLFSNNENNAVLSKKGLVNAFINLLYRPVAYVIAFSVGWSLAYAALQAMDSVSLMIIGDFSDTMDFDDITSMNLLLAMFFVGMAQFVVIKWVFSTTMKLPNMIIRHLGGDDVDEGQGVLGRLVAARIGTMKQRAMNNKAKADAELYGDNRFKGRNTRDKFNKVADFSVHIYDKSVDVGHGIKFIFDKLRGKNDLNYDNSPANDEKSSATSKTSSKDTAGEAGSDMDTQKFDTAQFDAFKDDGALEGDIDLNSNTRKDDQANTDFHRSGEKNKKGERDTINNLAESSEDKSKSTPTSE